MKTQREVDLFGEVDTGGRWISREVAQRMYGAFLGTGIGDFEPSRRCDGGAAEVRPCMDSSYHKRAEYLTAHTHVWMTH